MWTCFFFHLFSVSDESIRDLTSSCSPHRVLFDPIWGTIELHAPNFQFIRCRTITNHLVGSSPANLRIDLSSRSADFKMPARRWWFQWVGCCTIGEIHGDPLASLDLLMWNNTEAHQRSWLPWNYWPTPQWLSSVDLDDLGWTWVYTTGTSVMWGIVAFLLYTVWSD